MLNQVTLASIYAIPLSSTHKAIILVSVVAYQFGSPNAFWLSGHSLQTIDGAYVDGVSLTYGNPRQHIWTFAAALDEREGSWSCPCTDVLM